MRARLERTIEKIAATLRRRHEAERGFTLIEVISTVVIIGIISAPLGAAMVFGFRTVFEQQASMARTADVRQLSTYFPADVASVDATGVNPTDSNNVNICAANPLADETSLITFVWDEDLGIEGQSMARYLAKGSGKDSEIVRRFCRGAADPKIPASATNDWTDITLASHFGSDSPSKSAEQYTITTDPSAPVPNGTTPQCTASSCFIEIHGEYDYRLNANRRVKGETPGVRPPDAPSNVHGVSGNQRVTVYWTDGATNGSPLTSYTIETNTPGSGVLYDATTTNGASGAQINGLTNGTGYRFRVKATNAAGSSAFSDWTSPAIVPSPTTPDPPTIGTATASPTVNGSASVTWSLPSGYNNGGGALVGFRIYAINAPNAPVVVDVDNPAATSGSVTGLVDNTQYLLQVSARNAYGEGSPSAAANAIVTLPSAPGTPNAQYGGSSGTVNLTFSPPTTGDFSYLTNFRAKVASRAGAETAVATATACPSGAAGTCTLQVTGLTSGVTYSIAVQAQNSAGWGPLSAAATAEVTAPAIPSSTIAPVGGTNGGYIGQGNPYYVYANATDASGISTVATNVDNLTSGETSAPMTTAGGPWTISGTSYTYRSAPMTAGGSLSSGSKSYTITATDTYANSATTSFSVTVDNTAPTVTLTSVNGSVRTFPWSTSAASLTSVGGACVSGASDGSTITVTTSGQASQSGTATCSASSWTFTFPSALTAEGIYTFQASQTDYAGNTGTSGSKTVNLDRTGPTISRSVIASTIDTTVGGYIKSGGAYYVYANVTDPISGVATVNTNVTNITSGSTNVSMTAGSYTVAGLTYNYRTNSLTASSISAGSKTYTVTATDNAGGSSGAQTFTVTVDATVPLTSTAVIAASGSSTAGYVGAGRNYYVYANVSDAAGVQSVTANVTNITTGSTAVPLVAGSYTVGATAYGYRSAVLTATGSITAGSKTFTVTATDVATLSATTTWNVTVDNTSPVVAITKVNGVTAGSWPYSTNVNVTTVGGTCSSGATDSTTVNVTIAGTDNESGTATCASGAWTYTFSSAWSAEGSSTIDANQSDFAGNTGNATQRTVNIDKTVPVVTLTTPANGLLTNDSTPSLAGTCTTSQGNVAVAITGPTTTSVSGIACSGGNWSSTSPVLAAGTYTATATQTDAAGNIGTSNTNGFTLDLTNPTLASTIAPAGVTTGGYLAQGKQYYVYANATDSAGIASATSNVAVTSNVLTTGVTATPLTTAGGPWTIGATSYIYRSTALTANSSITSGSKNYTVSATDNAGNTATTTFTVTIDNTAPAPTVTSVNGSVRTFPYATNANVTSVGGACGSAAGDVATVSVTITGVENESGTATCTSGAWTYTLATAWTVEGSSSVVASQNDLAGNSGTSASKTISIDKTTPVVSATVMSSTTDTTVGGYVRQGGSYYVYANVTDASSGVSTVTANVTNITTGSTAVALSSGSYTVGSTSYNYRSSALTASNPLTAGTKTYTITATDVAGNSVTTPDQNVTVDNTVPAPSAFVLQNGATLGQIDVGDSFVVTYNGPINPSTICTGLTDATNVTGVSIALTGTTTNDTLGAPAAPCANVFTTVNLGGNYYTADKTLTTTFDWNASTNALTVSITALSSTANRSSGVPAGTPTYLPKTSILDPAGNAMVASTFNGSSSRF